MLNPKVFLNSRPDGYGVLEVVPENPDSRHSQQFVPLKHTALTGTVTGPLAALTLTQTFALPDQSQAVVEALYRFPLPGDAAVTGVRVRFGDVEIHTQLKERETAERDYQNAKKSGRQAALVTRESPDVFTLAVAGLRAGQDVVVQTEYLQVAKTEGAGWSLRVPLTTAPRFVRADEVHSRHAAGQPLALLRDPGHRFSLDLAVEDAEDVTSSTHTLQVEGDRVRLRDGEVVPDRDCVLSWRSKAHDSQPTLRVWTHTEPGAKSGHFLALCTPPKFAPAKRVPREVVLLVDHSGSMEGPKWEAADWAVERFLAGLNERDSFALGLFHDTTRWFAERPRRATPDAVREAVAFLKAHRDSGGTELGVSLEQALNRARSADTPSRHVLVLTDAEVSDAGRVLRLAEAEAEKPNSRRISVLCIDAAPNAALASELAERGGGVSRFLTSNPDEDDVTTALDEVLADWAAPVLSGLRLEVNRRITEVVGRSVSYLAPGPGRSVDLGDLPAGRPVWVLGRADTDSEPLEFRLRAGAEVLATVRPESTLAAKPLKSLFAADRVRRLEYVMTGGESGEKLRDALVRLGYDTDDVGETSVYAENALETSRKVVRDLLVKESLAGGVPCSETAFVAVRTEAGKPVTDTVAVANGLPHGWSNEFESGGYGGAGAVMSRAVPLMNALFCASFDDDADDTATDFDPLEAAPRLSAPQNATSGSAFLSKLRRASAPAKPAVPAFAPAPPASKREAEKAARDSAPGDFAITVNAGQHSPADGAVLFESATGNAGQLTFLSVSFRDAAVTADSLDPELTVLLFVGDLAAPRARVKLADVLRLGGRRPLNLRRGANDTVRLVLEDPNGAWMAGVPAMELVLGVSA